MEPQFDLSRAVGMPHFTIEGTMPSLNEYLAETGRRPQIGGKLKKEYKNMAIQYMRLTDFRYYKATKPIIIHYVFYDTLNVGINARSYLFSPYFLRNICGIG